LPSQDPGSPFGARGAVCLGNDAVIDWLIAFCASFCRHNPDLPLTLIPFDEQIERSRELITDYGYTVFAGPSLEQMDRLGDAYFPGDPIKLHTMRKFCAWESYRTFLYLDADVVVLRSLQPYFDALDSSGADFMHFATDMSQVYRPGPLLERMLSEHDSAGFNSGVFIGRRGQLTTERVVALADSVADLRPQFVDNLEQTFINYCVDVTDLRKADANEELDSMAVAGALMRIVGSGDDFVLEDRRVPYSGRPVSLIHWAGYFLNPLMAYRRTFLRYRLAGASRGERWRYHRRAVAESLRTLSPRHVYHLLRGAPFRLRSWLSARGVVGWRGTGD
jgi:hypothetical protein